MKNKKLPCGLCGLQFKKRDLAKATYRQEVVANKIMKDGKERSWKETRLRTARICSNCVARIHRQQFMRDVESKKLDQAISNPKQN